MKAEKTNRITQTSGTKVKKASKQLASCTSASSPHKRVVRVSSAKSMEGSFAKSLPTSSSDSECGRKGLPAGNATFNRKTSQGTEDAPGDATFSSSECSSENTSTEFEASNEISLKYIEMDETKCNTTAAEPDPGPHFKELDVLNSTLTMNWFSLDDNDFDDFLKKKTDQNSDIAGLEKQISLSCGVKAVDSAGSIPEDTNNTHTDESQGEDCREFSNTTFPQDKNSEDVKVVEEELVIIKTPDVQEFSNGENNFQQCEDEPASLETSEGTSEAIAQEHTQQAKASRNLLCLQGHGIDAFRGSPYSKVLLSILFVLFSIWLSVRKLTEGEMVPPPT